MRHTSAILFTFALSLFASQAYAGCAYNNAGSRLCSDDEGGDGFSVTYRSGQADFFHIETCNRVGSVSTCNNGQSYGKGRRSLMITYRGGKFADFSVSNLQ